MSAETGIVVETVIATTAAVTDDVRGLQECTGAATEDHDVKR